MFEFKKIKKLKFICGADLRNLYRREDYSFLKFGRSTDDFIKENYEMILQRRFRNELHDILDVLLDRDSLRDFMKLKMLYTMKQASNFEWFKVLEREYDFDWGNFFSENINELIDILDYEKIFEIMKFVNNLDENVKNKLNDILIKEKKEYIRYILFSKLNYNDNSNEYKVLLEIIILLVEEILKSENKRLVDIRSLSIGAYSDVIEIGTKIIKLGTRQLNEIAYDERILFPIIKVDLNKLGSLDAILEVTERANNNVELDRKDLYNIFSDMRDRGIVCADMRRENVGILLEDNIPMFGGKVFDNFETKGFISLPTNKRTLKKGEYVIIDLDYIYRENAINIKWANSMTRDFEKKYKEDKEIKKYVYKK